MPKGIDLIFSIQALGCFDLGCLFAELIVCVAQAVGPVAVTSLLLGNGLKDTMTAPVQSDPNDLIRCQGA